MKEIRMIRKKGGKNETTKKQEKKERKKEKTTFPRQTDVSMKEIRIKVRKTIIIKEIKTQKRLK